MEDQLRIEDSAGDDGPLPLRWAVLLLWFEGAGLAVLALVELSTVVIGNPNNPGAAVFLALMIAAVAVLAIRAGIALTHRRRWGRGISIVLQLLALPVAWFMTTGESEPAATVAGLALAALCLTCLALLLAPSSRFLRLGAR